MAVSKIPGIKNAVAEFRRGKRKAVSKYEMRSSNGTVFRFNLVIKKHLKETKDGRKWKYLTYATNVERWYIKHTMKNVPEEYKKRWRIETTSNQSSRCVSAHAAEIMRSESLCSFSL